MKWDETHLVLDYNEKSFVKVAISIEQNKFPSEKQCDKILEVLERARIEGYPL